MTKLSLFLAFIKYIKDTFIIGRLHDFFSHVTPQPPSLGKE